MEITESLAADLAILSGALADGSGDISETLRQLAADVRLAVRSYVGLTVVAGNGTSPLTLTAMEDFADSGDLVSSLTVPLSGEHADDTGVRIVVVLYAARTGAFVDLAADLSWLTGRPLTDFALDRHLRLPTERGSPSGVLSASLVNQAIGLLIGRGCTPEQAELEIGQRAAAAGHTRAEAARSILDRPHPDGTEPTVDP